ncbi:O-antigen ligase family protein [Thiovibrio sp. JS02]
MEKQHQKEYAGVPRANGKMQDMGLASAQEVTRGNIFYFCCVCASLFIFVARPGELFPALAGFKLGLSSIVLTCFAFVTSGGFNELKQADFPGLKMMRLFLLLGFLVIVFSSWPRMAFEGWRTIVLVNTLLYLFWLPAVKTPDRLRKFVIVLVLATGCLVYAMLFAESAVRYRAADLGRLSVGGTYDPNDVAMIMAVVFPFTFFLFLSAKFKGKVVWGGLLVCLVLGILSTGSRGGLLSLGTASLLLFFTAGKGLKTWHRVFVVAMVIVFFMSPAADTVKERWQAVLSGEDYNVESVEEGGVGRLSLWVSAAQLILENPLTGVGVSNSSNAMGVEYGRWRAIHNSYFQAALELGLPGFILFMLLLRTIWRNCSHARGQFGQQPHRQQLVLLAGCCRISLVVYMIAAFFLSQAYSLMVPILLLISDGLHHISVATHVPSSQIELG